jgi:murein DD-endopeptidase MepM/ murein hydrolase activator NlpD
MHYSVREVEYICMVNESRKNGRYPVSPDGKWHSGLHVWEKTVAYPLLGGQLVAYRIPKDYKKITRPNKITEEFYRSLRTDSERELYEKKFIMVTYYELISGKETQTDVYADGFILLKHKIDISGNSGENRDISFFSLYANIMPWDNKEEGYYKDYCAYNGVLPIIPFYQKHVFKVSNTPTTEYRYFACSSGDKVYEYCTCNIESVDEDNKTYSCRFANNRQATCGFDDIIAYLTYKPTGDNTIIYKKTMSKDKAMSSNEEDRDQEKEEDVLIKSKAVFVRTPRTITIKPHMYADTAWNKQTGYYEIEVYESDIKEEGNEKTKLYTALVKASEMSLTAGNGYLKENAPILQAAPSKGVTKGIRVHDGKTHQNPYGNTNRILEAGTAFEISEPEILSRTDKFLAFKWAGDTNTLPESGWFYNGDIRNNILVKITHREKYKQGETDIVEEEVRDNDVLGYSFQEPHAIGISYDAVVFFPSIGFMDKTPDAFFKGHVVPSGEPLYELNGSTLNETLKGHEEIILRNGTGGTGAPAGYTGFYYQGKTVYLPTSRLSVLEENLLDWSAFRKLNTEAGSGGTGFFNAVDTLAKNLFDKETDTDGDIFYDKKPQWIKDSFTNTAGGRAAKQEIRRIMCNHPLEWDKTHYLENGTVKASLEMFIAGEEWKRHLKEIAETLDIWDRLKSKTIKGTTFTKNSFWFAHPFYFINRLDRAGLVEFNPYFGLSFTRQWTENRVLASKRVTAKDNPGFAPLHERRDDAYDIENGYANNLRRDRNGNGYAVPTGLFNQEYLGTTVYLHEGVDLRGAEKSPIYALIPAKVINYGYTHNYGRTVILADLNKKGIYLLGHLSGYKLDTITRGAIVNVGDVVGYTGRSHGFKNEFSDTYFKQHLHISYYDVQYDPAKDTEINQQYVTKSDNDDLTFGGELQDKFWRDPFNHDKA